MTAQATQMITVTTGSGVIDAGGVEYNLSGDFGGFATDDDSAQLLVSFLGGSQLPIGGSINIGDYGAAFRNNNTDLFSASAKGSLPIGTRTIQVSVNMTRTNGTYNDGYADNLSLVLRPPTLYLPQLLHQ